MHSSACNYSQVSISSSSRPKEEIEGGVPIENPHHKIDTKTLGVVLGIRVIEISGHVFAKGEVDVCHFAVLAVAFGCAVDGWGLCEGMVGKKEEEEEGDEVVDGVVEEHVDVVKRSSDRKDVVLGVACCKLWK